MNVDIYSHSELFNWIKNEIMASTANEPEMAKDAVLVKSEKLPDVTPMVKGYDWNNGIDYDQLLGSYIHSGFQATNLGKAIDEVNKMVRLNDIETVFHSMKWNW